jgi:uncharacterized protein YjbI with pentapeptide repeats
VSDEVQRPISDEDRDGWKAYWTALGMAWRTEPEISDERQAFLSQRRSVKPNVVRGLYPFRGKNGSIKMARADVEWLLATHNSGGMRGPVDWSDEEQREREGIDLRGADLNGVDLAQLPLARLQAGLTRAGLEAVPRKLLWPSWVRAAVHLEQANLAGVHLEGAELGCAQATSSVLHEAHLENAYLKHARLRGADLRGAHLEGACLWFAFLEGANLSGAHLQDALLQTAQLEQANLTGANFRGAHLWSAYLRDVDLTGAILDEAIWTRTLRDDGAGR